MIRHLRVKQNSLKLPYSELDRRGMCYLFCEIGNKRGFIVGQPAIINNLSMQKYIEVTIVEEKKYKPVDQYMRMMTGRIPMGSTKNTYTGVGTFRGRIIGGTQSLQPYFVWEIL
jgi:hypothetical protein